jgi:hypothetical protein
MADPNAAMEGGPGNNKDLPTEDTIRVVCRFRPLNDSEERAGSKFVFKFPDEQCTSIGVSQNSTFSKVKTLYNFAFFSPGQSLHV